MGNINILYLKGLFSKIKSIYPNNNFFLNDVTVNL